MYCDQPSLLTRDPGGGVNEEIPHRWAKQQSRKLYNKNAHSMYGGDCDAAIAKAATAVTHVQSQSQEVGSGDEELGLLCFDLSSAETDFWWLEDEQ